MLEKEAGNLDMAKLRVILLLEVDFNRLNKIIFNNRILLKLKQDKVISAEVIRGRRGQSSTYIALNKKIIADISNQTKKPSVVISADTTNCYNRIAHSYTSISY